MGKSETHEDTIAEMKDKNYTDSMYLLKVAVRLKAQETAIEVLTHLGNAVNTVAELDNTRRSQAREVEILEENIRNREAYIIALKELIANR